MGKNRREFLKISGLGGFGLMGATSIPGCRSETASDKNWQADPEWLEVKYGQWGGPGLFGEEEGPMDNLLLRDWAPKSTVVVAENFIQKASHPVIDIHTHNYASQDWSEPPDPEVLAEWVDTMDEVGIEKSVLLTQATGDAFDRIAESYLGLYPDRFQLYCGLDTNGIDQPDYPERITRELERCYRNGARGIGEVTDKGKGLTRDFNLAPDERLHPDDDRLDAFWQKAAELNLPVNLHIADHPSAWRPLDVFQERTPEYQQFNMHERNVLPYNDLIGVLESTLQKHPETTFIACHLANLGNDLGRLSGILDTYSNFYLDISARDYELGRTPRAAKRFLEQYSNRVMFGTDMGLEKTMYQAWWRLLETDDEYITGRIWWPYYGLDLSDSVVRALYRDNAERILNWE